MSRQRTCFFRTPGTWLPGVLLWAFAMVLQAACPPPAETETVVVDYVTDGDTLRLSDGRKVRLVGINTPEFGRDGNPDQPLAKEARRALREMLPEDRRVYLQPGADPRDHYGRELASVFLTPAGGHLGERLLARGLGWRVTVPPNLRYRECLGAAERRARRADLGVWGQEAYRPRPVTELRAGESGFMRVVGVVTKVAESRRAVWIELQSRLSLRVDRKDLPRFPEAPSPAWEGRRLTARGWVIHRGESPRGYPPHMMHLRHPDMVERRILRANVR